MAPALIYTHKHTVDRVYFKTTTCSDVIGKTSRTEAEAEVVVIADMSNESVSMRVCEIDQRQSSDMRDG